MHTSLVLAGEREKGEKILFFLNETDLQQPEGIKRN